MLENITGQLLVNIDVVGEFSSLADAIWKVVLFTRNVYASAEIRLNLIYDFPNVSLWHIH